MLLRVPRPIFLFFARPGLELVESCAKALGAYLALGQRKKGGRDVFVFCLVFGFDTVAVAGLRRTGSAFGEPVICG